MGRPDAQSGNTAAAVCSNMPFALLSLSADGTPAFSLASMGTKGSELIGSTEYWSRMGVVEGWEERVVV